MLYLYGVARASTAPPTRKGVGAEAVTTIKAGEIAALVSSLPDGEHRARKEDLLAHSDVLQEVVSQGDEVLPMRFGAVFGSEDELRSVLLEPNAAAFLNMLDSVKGSFELQVKGSYIESAIVSRVVEGDRRIRRLRESSKVDAQIELGRLVAAGIERERYADGRRIVEALERYAGGIVLGDPAGEYGVVNTSFLVDRERAGDFDAAFEKVRDQVATFAQLRCLGPMPPYSFVDAGSLTVGRWA